MINETKADRISARMVVETANHPVTPVADAILVDGAKRDRTVWPGDLGVSVPTEYASLGDVTPTRNALNAVTFLPGINTLTSNRNSTIVPSIGV